MHYQFSKQTYLVHKFCKILNKSAQIIAQLPRKLQKKKTGLQLIIN